MQGHLFRIVARDGPECLLRASSYIGTYLTVCSICGKLIGYIVDLWTFGLRFASSAVCPAPPGGIQAPNACWQGRSVLFMITRRQPYFLVLQGTWQKHMHSAGLCLTYYNSIVNSWHYLYSL